MRPVDNKSVADHHVRMYVRTHVATDAYIHTYMLDVLV